MEQHDELTDLDLSILRFEHTRWRYPGAKDDEIRRRFDMSPTRFYQRLNAIIDRPAALIAEPQLVHRLQRLRGERRRAG